MDSLGLMGDDSYTCCSKHPRLIGVVSKENKPYPIWMCDTCKLGFGGDITHGCLPSVYSYEVEVVGLENDLRGLKLDVESARVKCLDLAEKIRELEFEKEQDHDLISKLKSRVLSFELEK